MKFSPQLNVRTAYNFQESLLKIDDYLDFAKENQFEFVFYADHLCMFGAAEFYQKAQRRNLKPVIGLTIEVETDTLILLAKNRNGYQKLCYLATMLSEKTSFNEISLPELQPFLSSDLIIVGDNKKLQPFFVEKIQPADQYWENIVLPKISYLSHDQEEAFQVIKNLKNGLIKSEGTKFHPEHYLSDEEISKISSSKKQNSLIQEIASKCQFQLFNSSNHFQMIKFSTPNNLSSFTFLKKLCDEALAKLLVKKNFADYRTRLNYELATIKKMGFEDYFLVVWDYVNFAKQQNIVVGPGRGSAAGSLVSYLLEITTVDPLEYDLLFERFLNPERLTMPDIDIDFQDDRRDEVIEYLFEKYGKFKMATIVTYQTIGAKSALRDVARFYELDLEIVNAMTKNIDVSWQNDLTGAIKHNHALATYAQQYPQIFMIAKTLMGLPRQTGTHAAGIVLSQNDLRDSLPLKLGYNGIYQTQFDMNYLEPLGLIKMDLLGLRNLTTLKIIQTNILKSHKTEINFAKIALNDSKTFMHLAQGQTSGIFQLESPGMTRVVEEMKVGSIEDISAASALFRPGPQEMIGDYVKRKNHPSKKMDYLIDESLKDILAPTYGIIVYQEQVIQILQKVANFSLAKADIVRRAMGKKDWKVMHSAEDEFLAGALKNHHSSEKAREIWNWIEKFASYGFNKSHSIAYSYISYWLAYLKTYYPAEFYAALLSGVLGNDIKTGQYLKEVQQLGIKIHNPSVKNMNFNYVSQKKNLYLPLILIKGVGLEFIKKLREVFQDNPQLFDSIFSFATKMFNHGLNHQTFKALTWAGALDLFGHSRQTLINNEAAIFNFAKLNQNLKEINPQLIPVLEVASTPSELASLNEKNYLGFYLSAHPLTEIRKQRKELKTIPISGAKENNGYNRILGVVENIRIKVDKNGQEMAFIEVFDDSDKLSVTIFGRMFDQVRNEFQINSILALKIKIEEYKGKVSASLLEIIEVIRK